MPSPTRRPRAGRLADDAPSGEGTLFADVAETPTAAVPQEPDWLRDVPIPGNVPVELTADERRAREDEQEVTEKARAATRAQEIVGRLNPEQARAVTTTDGPLLILAGAG